MSDELVTRALARPLYEGHGEESDLPEQLADRIKELEAQVRLWKQNSRETFDAMVSMRNDINQHVPMPSLESDLLSGPANSVFCAAVAQAVVAALATERETVARLREALEAMLHAVCHPTGFAAAVREHTGVAYPWEPLDAAEERALAALAPVRAHEVKTNGV